MTVGGAQISTKHANFIVNKDNATARDVLALIGIIREKVKESFNINLELEIEIIGEMAMNKGKLRWINLLLRVVIHLLALWILKGQKIQCFQ